MEELDNSKYYNHVIANGVTIRELQMKLLEIFIYFKKICEENNLTYWCGGGTMLGAIRHKGFIPWDDDLDVFMPRSDYEELYRIWNKVADTSHYALVRTTLEQNYHHTAMNLVDLKTTFINKHVANEDIYHGAYIDVIPFEGAAPTFWGKCWQFVDSILYGVFNAQRLPDNQGNLLKLPTKFLLNLVKTPEKRYKIWKSAEKRMTRYDFYTSDTVKETVTSFRALFWEYQREIFDTIEVPFENITIRIPAGYDLYMKTIFGDYMSLPPAEKRLAKSEVINFIDLNSSYIKYKGKHYMCKTN